ncbi:MAG: hypothetical protein PF693_00025 [Spirochaetia bacterium]|nr:hypothetical protein [Spirochaetia bacterium]
MLTVTDKPEETVFLFRKELPRVEFDSGVIIQLLTFKVLDISLTTVLISGGSINNEMKILSTTIIRIDIKLLYSVYIEWYKEMANINL